MDKPEQAAANPPAFAEGFRQKIALGKYTGWAIDLTEDQLIAVLWAVGEYGRRSQPVVECLDRHASEFSPADGWPRARLGLQLLAEISDRRFVSSEQVIERVRAVLREWRESLGITQD
ncbi:MAG: hypothetical protein K8T25_05055 [Planctomycetia bacterium]|nr:hypothetical protein [Planctomycetia bacterium]